MHKGMPIGATAHQAGTVRFGTRPASSALDINCKAHELDNLYVVDTSFFPSIGAVNPSLTAIANALRVGDHLRRATRRDEPAMTTNETAWQPNQWTPWSSSARPVTWPSWRPSPRWSDWSTAACWTCR